MMRNLSEGPLPVRCDPMELEMAVLNLVLNARNAIQDSGAETGTIFLAYALQIAALTAVGIVLGLALGAALPLVFRPLIEAQLPLPAVFGVHPGPLVEAAIYGVVQRRSCGRETLKPRGRDRLVSHERRGHRNHRGAGRGEHGTRHRRGRGARGVRSQAA